jgi:thiamine biosynthesis lipoprotein
MVLAFRAVALFLLAFGATWWPGWSVAQTHEPTDQPKRFEADVPAMGVLFHVVAYAADEAVVRDAMAKVESRLHSLEMIFSDYRADSEAMQLVRHPTGTTIEVSPELWTVLQTSLALSEESLGAFDVTLGPVTQLWRKARQQQQFPDAATLAEAMTRVGPDGIRLVEPSGVMLKRSGMQLDFGGIAKGYAADACLAIFRAHGIRAAFVDASGDIALGDPPPGKTGWTVGVAGHNPDGPNLCLLRASNCGIATSSDARQALVIDGRRYSHIIDARTGQALTNSRSVTVIAPDGALADGWASAWSVLEPAHSVRQADEREDLDVLIQTIDDHGCQRVFLSHGFAKWVVDP